MIESDLEKAATRKLEVRQSPSGPAYAEALAIDGGEPVRRTPFGPRWVFGSADRQQLMEVMDRAPSAWHSGFKVREFCQALAKTYGSRHAIAVGSGTAAIHAAVGAINPEPGEEIITTPATDVGTVIGILQHNAVPVFADWDPHQFNTDPSDIRRKLTERTRAILVVHLFGRPCDMDAIMAIARDREIPIIEDCAQSHLAEFKGRKVGTFGDIACFSLGQKTLTTDQGGFVLTDSLELARRVRGFAGKGSEIRDEEWLPYARLGNFAPMTDLQAAIGLAQLSRLEEFTRTREHTARILDQTFFELPGFTVPSTLANCRNTYYVYPYHLNETIAGVSLDNFVAALKAEGITDAFGPYLRGRPLYRYPIFSEARTYGHSGFPLKDECGLWRADYRYVKLAEVERLLPGLGFFNLRNSYTTEDAQDIALAVRKVANHYRVRAVSVLLSEPKPAIAGHTKSEKVLDESEPRSSAPPEAELLRRREELRARSPYKAPILLPTDSFPLTEQVKGLERVCDIWERMWPQQYSLRLRELREQYLGRERCFVIGNGPSLNRIDLELLRNEVSFGTNNLFLKFSEIGFRPTFYVVEDHLVAEDRREEISALSGMIKIFPINLAYCFDESPDTIFINHRPRVSYPRGFDFSTDASKVTYAGCTVTFTCIQLAFYFGFRRIYLVGVDHNYDLPADIKMSERGGVSILDMKSDDPNHFHPDYFGKGRRWHNPQVVQKELAFEEARRATEAEGVEILNATKGGKLEIFPRVDYASLFPVATPDATSHPRLLIFDISRMGHWAATGQLKQNLLSGWPSNALMQVYVAGENTFGVIPAGSNNAPDVKTTYAERVRDLCEVFAPEIIYFRPVDSRHVFLHELACSMINALNVPYVIHMVDDWPSRLKRQDLDRFEEMDRSLRRLLNGSAHCLSICKAMSDAFKRRYALPFTPIANGVDPEQWRALTSRRKRRERAEDPFVIRYIGALAEDMCFDSVSDVAAIVCALRSSLDVRLEIYTLGQWKIRALESFGNLLGVSVHESGFTVEQYAELLIGCDALLVAYNFDHESVDYVRYSMANKLPECLASGVPVLVYGPRAVATVAFAHAAGVAEVVSQRDRELLTEGIITLSCNPSRARALGERASEFAFEELSGSRVRERFQSILRDAAAGSSEVRSSAQVFGETGVGGDLQASRSGHSTHLIGTHSPWHMRWYVHSALRRVYALLRGNIR